MQRDAHKGIEYLREVDTRQCSVTHLPVRRPRSSIVCTVAAVLLLCTAPSGDCQYARPSPRVRTQRASSSPEALPPDITPAVTGMVEDEQIEAPMDAAAGTRAERETVQPNYASQARISTDGPTAGAGVASSKKGSVRQAYVTLVTTPKYVVGAEVLAKSLRAFNTTRPLVALVDTSLPETVKTRLEEAGWRTQAIEHVANVNSEQLQNRPWFETTFSKLHVFGLTEFDRIVWLDADLLVLEDLDPLFACELHSDPAHPPFAAASEVFPPDTFNSGVMIVAPSKKLHQELLRASATLRSYDGSDQGFLNAYFSRWWEAPAGNRLPFRFNVPQTLALYFPPGWRSVLAEGIAVLHFAGDDSMKPWSFSGVVPPSLASYLALWQALARAPLRAPSSDLAAIYAAHRLPAAQDEMHAALRSFAP